MQSGAETRVVNDHIEIHASFGDVRRVSHVMTARVSLIPLSHLPRVQPGDDVVELLLDALKREAPPEPQDVLVVSHKILSKAQDRIVDLGTVQPSAEARELAKKTGKPPELVEAILSESKRIVRYRPGIIIAEHRLGMVMANAGIDRSNVPGSDDQILLLPKDPDADARAIFAAISERFDTDIGVVIADSAGRAWRNGVVGMAIGVAGLPALKDLWGKADLEGRALEVTEVGFADQIASAAHLIMGEADEGVPAVLIRGLSWQADERPAADLIRPPSMDLFR